MGFCNSTGPARRQAFAGLALSLAAACDSAAPAGFSAEATAADLAALNAVFESPAIQGLAFASTHLDGDGGTGGPSSTAGASVPRLSALYRSLRPGSSSGTPLAGTWSYDPAQGSYVVSATDPAPAEGARYILYVIDPDLGVPAEPLAPLGQADLVEEAPGRMRIVVSVDGAARLDYVVSADEGAERVTVAGHALHAGERVEFEAGTAIAM